jgi:hypothetical protein
VAATVSALADLDRCVDVELFGREVTEEGE